MLTWIKRILNPTEITNAYETFHDYISDQPINVYHNNTVVGSLIKDVSVTNNDDIVVYRLSYDPIEMDKILVKTFTDAGKTVPTNTKLVFNGSDVVISGRLHKPLYVPMPIVFVVTDGESEKVINHQYLVPIEDTRLSVSVISLDLQDIIEKSLKELVATHPGLEHVKASDIRLEDDILYVQLDTNNSRKKPIRLNSVPTEKLIDNPIHFELGDDVETIEFKDASIDYDSVSRKVESMMPVGHKVKTIETHNNHYDVITEFNYDTYDDRTVAVLLDFHKHTPSVSEELIQEYLLNRYSNPKDKVY